MLPVHPSKRYPHLFAFCAEMRRRPLPGTFPDVGTILKFVALLIAGTAAFRLMGWWGADFLFATTGLVGLMWLLRKSRGASSDPRVVTRRRAQKTAHTLMRLMEQHRLHRDLDPASVTILEEGARQWDMGRRHNARLEPLMLRLIDLYSYSLPQETGQRSLTDWVAEANETFRRQSDPRLPPPFFEEAREIVHEMARDAAEVKAAYEELDGIRESGPRPSQSATDDLRERLRG